MNRKPKRAPITAATRHALNEQCDTACAVCRETKTSKLTVHHIDGNRQDSSLGNLLLVCASCHSEFTSGTKSEADAKMFKRMAETGFLFPRKVNTPQPPIASTVNNVGINQGVVAGSISIDKLEIPRDSRGKSPRDLLGTIGANADMRTYADYLVKKYIYCRKNGEKRVKQRGGPFKPGAAHSILGQGFGVTNSVMQISQERFFEWIATAQHKIRRTVFAKSIPHDIFHSWEEHLRQRRSNL